MIIDDRLNTVLRTAPVGEAGVRLQYRQLIDLLGRVGGLPHDSLRERGLARLRELDRDVDPAVRRTIVAAGDGPLRDSALILQLLSADSTLVGAVSRRIALDEAEWDALIAELKPDLRQALAEQPGLPAGVRSRLIETRPGGPVTAIGELVRRIDAHLGGAAPRIPAAPTAAATRIAFVSDTQAMIVAADAEQGALAGRRLTDAAANTIDAASAIRLARHLPVRGGTLSVTGSPAVSGTWIIDALPRFDAATGAFQGHYGEIRRPLPAPANDAVEETADRIRQLLHELRTPINAIQGFGELIQQQLFGPVPHGYRSLAAGIVAQAGTMLAACDAVERLAVLARDGLGVEPGQTDLAALVSGLTKRLASAAERRGARIETREWPATLIPSDAETVESLLWRVLSIYAGALAAGDTLRLDLAADGGFALISGAVEGNGGETPWLDAGPLGRDFALRLTTAEARAMRGRFQASERGFVLSLPLAHAARQRAG